MKKYTEWITANVIETYGKCFEATSKMQSVFPELQLIRGYYYCSFWGQREHWWLHDQVGNIVDPTANQFPSKGKGFYEEWDESLPEPTGKCPNCGGYCYNGDYCCTSECYAALCS